MKKATPPQWIHQFLTWILDPEKIDYLLIDLEEYYDHLLEKKGLKKAKLAYLWIALGMIRFDLLKPGLRPTLPSLSMWGNFFKIAWRNMVRQKVYTVINLTGLTVSFMAFILILAYVSHELSFDTLHKNHDQIFRVIQQQKGNLYHGSDFSAVSPAPLAGVLTKDYPEVEAVTTFHLLWNTLLNSPEKAFYASALYVDTSFSSIFPYTVIEGADSKALQNENSVILTRSLAKKYFGHQTPYQEMVGQTIYINKTQSVIVKGIIQDPPRNQHFSFDFLISLMSENRYEKDLVNWKFNRYYTYVILPKNTDLKAFEEKLLPLGQEYHDGEGKEFAKSTFHLQNVKDVHFDSYVNFNLEAHGDIRYVYAIFSIAIIILLLAIINYVNLSTARAGKRAKEIGMRKIIGAKKSELIWQFLGESFLFSLFSFSLSLILIEVFSANLSPILGIKIHFLWADHWQFTLMVLCIAIVSGILSGLYPAFVLSSFKPVKILKGNPISTYKSGWILRNGLVIGQFSATVALVLVSFVISQQLSYIQNKKLGYNREQIVLIPIRDRAIKEKAPILKEQILQHPDIQSISFFNFFPLNIRANNVVSKWEGNPDGQQASVFYQQIDKDYLDLFEIEFLEGNHSALSFSSDSNVRYILNEAAVKAANWKSGLGKRFDDGKVVGVVKDYHFQRLDQEIAPLYMELIPSTEGRRLAIKLNGNEPQEALKHIESEVKKLGTGIPFSYEFMDDTYHHMYDAERKFSRIFGLFTFIALVIAGLGLWSLSSFMTERRIKEISIRRVLGASTMDILGLLWTKLLQPVGVAIIIAIPIGYYFSLSWLEDFAYRVKIEPLTLAIVIFMILLIAVSTISYHSIRSIRRNPIDAFIKD